jgi:uncharacterized phage protein gp47/JayE
LSIPSYNDILAYYTSNFLSTYGQSVNLDNSAADEQFLAIWALAAADYLNCLQLAYNAFSPTTAIRSALDAIVALNGMTRLPATNSTCTVTLGGVVGTIIVGGIVADINGNLWNLPASVTIGGGGLINTTATAQQTGAITVGANQITVISTAVGGWTSVSNGSNLPNVGEPIETDSQLRTRQAISTELPSETLLAGTIASILAVPGVTRINNGTTLSSQGTTSIENFTGGTDDWGNPAHSLSCVVEGGTNLAVATAIYNNRGIGPNTNGSTGGTLVTVSVTDPNSGITIPINFARPTETAIHVIVNAHLLAGGTAATITAIQSALVAYLNSLQIGESVNWSSLMYIAMSVNTNPSLPIVRIGTLYLSLSGGSFTTTADLALDFYQVSEGVTANVVVNSI